MKNKGISTLQSQAVMVVSLVPNAIGVLLVGWLLDRPTVRALWANLACVIVGVPLAYGVWSGVGSNLAANYLLMSVYQLVVGAGMGLAVLPVSRIYKPLERTTGFSFGYNLGYGVLGGMSPLIITSTEYGMTHGTKWLAPAVWLTALGALSIIGVFALRKLKPRLNEPEVTKLA
jgi:MFS family permease